LPSLTKNADEPQNRDEVWRQATNALKREVMKGKKVRQAVLKRVRKQRALVVKRLRAKIYRFSI
jgi:hypothetical protein